MQPQASFYDGNKTITTGESVLVAPGPGEVRIDVAYCGLCGTDLHIYLGHMDQRVAKRQIMGHEMSGTVAELGEGVTGWAVGDRVVVRPLAPCGECAACKRGDEHLCTPGRALGIVVNGGFADHVLVPHSRYLFDKGDVNESLAATYACSGLTAYSALKKVGELHAGDELVIIGAGGVGMMAIQVARAQGLDPVVVDIAEEKLAAARDLGVTRTFDSSDPGSAKAIKKATGGAYAAIDFVGAESSVNFGLSCLRKGGMLIIVGLYGGSLTMPLPFIPMNARIIQGSYVGTLQDMKELMELVRAGKIAPIDIVERPLAEASDALADLKAGKVRGRQVLVTGN